MPELVKLNQFDFHHRLAETPGPALVIVTGPDCGACRSLKGLLASGALPDVNLFEVDAEQDLALTAELEVFHLPALFLYRDGRFHHRIEAELTAESLQQAVNGALTGPSEEAP